MVSVGLWFTDDHEKLLNLFIYFLNTVSEESSSMELLTTESLMWEEAAAIIKKVRIS